MSDIREVIGDYEAFIRNIDDGLTRCGIRQKELAMMDHICYRVETAERYQEMMSELAKRAFLLDESEVAGRLIATFEFDSPLEVNGYGTAGDLALGGKDYHYTAPTTPMLTLSTVSDFTGTIPSVVYTPSAQDYQLVWSDQHSGADEDGAVWVPQQAGYVALGYAATRNYQATQQSLPPSQYMVRADLVSPATLYEPIPNCTSSEAENCNQVLIYANFGKHSGTRELAVDPVLPGTGAIGASAFYAHADWNMPTGAACASMPARR